MPGRRRRLWPAWRPSCVPRTPVPVVNVLSHFLRSGGAQGGGMVGGPASMRAFQQHPRPAVLAPPHLQHQPLLVALGLLRDDNFRQAQLCHLHGDLGVALRAWQHAARLSMQCACSVHAAGHMLGRPRSPAAPAPPPRAPRPTSMNCMRKSLLYLMRSPSFFGAVSSARVEVVTCSGSGGARMGRMHAAGAPGPPARPPKQAPSSRAASPTAPAPSWP